MIERCCNHAGYLILVTCSMLGATCYIVTLLHCYTLRATYVLSAISYQKYVGMTLWLCWGVAGTVLQPLQPRWWNNAGMMLEQCMNDVPAAFQQHPSRAILPAASFQRHRSSIVSASFQHIRCSIVPALLPALLPASFQHHSSIIPASFEHRFSQHLST